MDREIALTEKIPKHFPARARKSTEPSTRTSFPEAIKTVLTTLDTGESFSISDLSRQANINRRTLEKTIETLVFMQKYLLKKRLEIIRSRNAKIVQLSERFGLLNLPEELQTLIIKTVYYPSPSREEEILVFAHRQKALSPQTSTKMEKSTLVKKLLKQGQFLETRDGKLYLSDEGRIVAEGVLKLYPELNAL